METTTVKGLGFRVNYIVVAVWAAIFVKLYTVAGFGLTLVPGNLQA